MGACCCSHACTAGGAAGGTEDEAPSRTPGSQAEYEQVRARALSENKKRLLRYKQREARGARVPRWRRGALSDEEILYIWWKDAGCCVQCKRALRFRYDPHDDSSFELDHIDPKCNAESCEEVWGLHAWQAMCSGCNRRKGARAKGFAQRQPSASVLM